MGDKRFERIEIYDGPNRMGDYHFALFWYADYHPGAPVEHERRLRGQHYLAPLKEWANMARVIEDLRSNREKYPLSTILRDAVVAVGL